MASKLPSTVSGEILKFLAKEHIDRDRKYNDLIGVLKGEVKDGWSEALSSGLKTLFRDPKRPGVRERLQKTISNNPEFMKQLDKLLLFGPRKVKAYADLFRGVHAKITDTSSTLYWANKIKDEFGMQCSITKTIEAPHLILRQCYQIFSQMGEKLVRACGVDKFMLSDRMGESKPKFPNHGFYRHSDTSVTLNADIFVHPDQPEDFYDDKNYFLTRGEQTLIHEMGHAFDAAQGDLSGKPEWLKLSGWSETHKPGLKRLIIDDPGSPKVVGEMWFSPPAKFTRFYGSRNSWDDMADCFSFYVAGMSDKVPASKVEYLDRHVGKYLTRQV